MSGTVVKDYSERQAYSNIQYFVLKVIYDDFESPIYKVNPALAKIYLPFIIHRRPKTQILSASRPLTCTPASQSRKRK